jgi:hypothetical protein
MAQTTNRLSAERNLQTGNRLPKLSTELDSVRVYQFEVQFWLPDSAGQSAKSLSVAAKKVSATGPKVEPIEVHRLNDKYYYPGKPSMEEVTITFDNLLQTQAGANLFAWFRTCTYDPLTGYQTPIASVNADGSRRSFKMEKVRVIQYDGTMTPTSYVDFIGVWPMAIKMAEFNYSQNDFHTIDVTLKYDFIDIFPSTLRSESDLTTGFFPN